MNTLFFIDNMYLDIGRTELNSKILENQLRNLESESKLVTFTKKVVTTNNFQIIGKTHLYPLN